MAWQFDSVSGRAPRIHFGNKRADHCRQVFRCLLRWQTTHVSGIRYLSPEPHWDNAMVWRILSSGMAVYEQIVCVTLNNEV